MRRMWGGLSCLTAAVLALVGCWTTQSQIKPPPHQEEYKLPPDELRYANPPEFPKNTLNQGLNQRDKDSGKDMGPGGLRGPGGAPRFGAGGPGMGY